MKDQEDEFPEFNYDKIVKETDEAFLFDIYGDGTKNVWIPKSQIEHDADNCTFNIPRWLAIKKELL